MRRLVLPLVLIGLNCFSGPEARAAIAVHDDFYLDYVRASSSGTLGNSGTAVTFPNNGGPFWAAVLDDSRLLTGSPPAQRDGSTVHWVNAENRNGSPYTTVVDSFFTFCVERNETFSPGSVYDIRDFGPESIQSNRLMTGYTAWVYERFKQAVQPLGNVVNPRAPSANAKLDLGDFQKAIWMGMVQYADVNGNKNFDLGESFSTPGSAGSEWVGAPDFTLRVDWTGDAVVDPNYIDYTTFLNDASWWGFMRDKLGRDLTEREKLLVFNGYQVINVQTDAAGKAQDQIIGEGGPLTLIPEPAAIIVWSVLASGAAAGAALRRRQRPAGRARWSDENRRAIVSIIEGSRQR